MASRSSGQSRNCRDSIPAWHFTRVDLPIIRRLANCWPSSSPMAGPASTSAPSHPIASTRRVARSILPQQCRSRPPCGGGTENPKESEMTTVYIPDPEPLLQPFDDELAAARAGGAELVLGDPANPVIRDAEVILTAGMRFSPETLRTLTRCRLIVRYGIGVDTIDLAGATECGIVVANCPTYCVPEVADHASALILSLARRVPWLDRQVRAGEWRSAQHGVWGVRRMSELTVGIVGMGKIGSQVARRMTAFGCRILGFDPFLSSAQIQARGAEPIALDGLMQASDLISLHVPL